jgi:xanthine dehydrogenase accessory factor
MGWPTPLSIAKRFTPRISAYGDPAQSTVSSMGTSNADFPGANVVRVAADLLAARQPFALTIVIEATGSTSAHPGDKAVFDTEGTILSGWVGGGCAESTIAHAVLESIADAMPRIVDVNLDDEVLGAGMPCGGRMKVYVEPFSPQPKLWILGHGRVAECLCHLGALLSFDVIVDDMMASPDRYPGARQVIVDDLDYSALDPAASDFVVIATQHRGDHESLRRLLTGEARYIALIASRKRANLVLDYLRAAGFGQHDIERIRAPAGIELGARMAEEIALSVISEIVMVRRGRAARCGTGDATDKRLEPPTGDNRRPTMLSTNGRHALQTAGS